MCAGCDENAAIAGASMERQQPAGCIFFTGCRGRGGSSEACQSCPAFTSHTDVGAGNHVLLVVHYVRQQGACDPPLSRLPPSKHFCNTFALVQHVRDGAIAMGDIPALLSHVRECWSEGHDESAAIVAVCKAVEMMASGILVSLREAETIAEGLHVRARARTPMIQTSYGDLHQHEEDELYEGFEAAAELVAERQQIDGSGASAHHQPPASQGPTAANTFTHGKSSPTGIVRR